MAFQMQQRLRLEIDRALQIIGVVDLQDSFLAAAQLDEEILVAVAI